MPGLALRSRFTRTFSPPSRIVAPLSISTVSGPGATS
jgi:hypothetical protein